MEEKLKKLWDNLFVRKCINCGTAIKTTCDINVCDACNRKVSVYGQTINIPDRVVVSALPYDKHIRKHMHKFKFQEKKYLGYTFAKLLYKKIASNSWSSEIQCVTCVPMLGRRRSYNQSAVIAEQIASLLDVPFAENALVKIKNNPPLYTLTYKQKSKVVKGAYDLGEDLSFKGKTVLLVDDIYTTGSTINECRRVLNKNGAGKVYSATACYKVEKR